MFNENDFDGLFKSSDEKFRKNFDSTLEQLKSEEIAPRRIRRPRWQTALAAFAACIALTGTAYAVSVIIDRVDLGASWELVSAPENYYEELGETFYRPAYNSETAIEAQQRLDAETAKDLRELLEGQIFNKNGEPVDVLAAIPDSDEFRIDDGGSALYNETGEELYEIRYETVGFSGPQSIMLWTKAERNAALQEENIYRVGIGHTDKYELAAEMLGTDFVLPTVYVEEREAPDFWVQIEDDRQAIYVTYKGKGKYDPAIFYFAETEREEGRMSSVWYADGAIIEQHEIKGLTVYKAVSKSIIRYTWTQDGVIYMLFQDYSPWEFTDEQFIEIIESMIK